VTDPAVNRRDHRATGQTWRDYLEWFHHDRPGVTTDTLGTDYHDGTDPYRWALEPLGPRPTRLIDIACGDAPIFDRSPSPGWVGIDTSNSELRQARRHGAPRLIRADVTQIPLATGSAPAVICSMALMIVQPLDAVLAEIRRVLTPDGTAVALLPGGWPLTARDLYRYTQLMITLRRPRLAYPNDRHLARLRAYSRQARLEIVDDRRRRFALPLPDHEAAERFVASLYLPGAQPARTTRAAGRAATWVPGAIGIPLRRITLRPQGAPGRLPTAEPG
jgi:SAM-dependent methyltransferase